MHQPCELILTALDSILNQKPLPDLCSLYDSRPLQEIYTRLIQLDTMLTDRQTRILELENQVRDFAFIDSMTGVASRRAGLQTLQAQIFACAGRVPLSLCFVDLDGLKQVNDRYGHCEGDLFIRRVSRVLQKKIRGTDTVARIGGDEFIVVMPGTSHESAHWRMREIQEHLTEHAPADGLSDLSDLLNLPGPSDWSDPSDRLNLPDASDRSDPSGLSPEYWATASECRDYAMAFSFGVATVLPEERTTAEILLNIADQNMFACKRKKQLMHEALSGQLINARSRCRWKGN